MKYYRLLVFLNRENPEVRAMLTAPVSDSGKLSLWLAGFSKEPVYAINVTLKEVRHDPLRTEPLRAPSGVGGSAPRRPIRPA